MFFFFFNELYTIADIKIAFKNICLRKMLSDGYFDMSTYIYGKLSKEELYAKLIGKKSKYAKLYQIDYPKEIEAYDVWMTNFGSNEDVVCNSDYNSDYEESIAIVNWVYSLLENDKSRELFTKELFRHEKSLDGIMNDVSIKNGVVYNKETVDLNIFSDITRISSFISSLEREGQILVYRGHSNANYILQPSIMRNANLEKNESSLYHELLINCPNDFINCNTHLEKLVHMQHYGLPTRLLDVTRNLLVAIYFACEKAFESYGEVVLVQIEYDNIKYPQSDVVSILASLPALSSEKREEIYNLACDDKIGDERFNDEAKILLHEIRIEKPSFQPEIKKKDVLNSYFVYALKNNNRIIKQDGAFIICGLLGEQNTLEKFRYKNGNKKVVILVDKKEEILKELEQYSINKSTLFPEIESVAKYLQKKYS